MTSRSPTPNTAYRGAIAPTVPSRVAHVRRRALRARPLEVVLIAGLAGVFLVNAVVAIVEPSDFTELIERSLVGRAAPVMSERWIAWAVAANDLCIGAALIAAIWMTRAKPFVLAWAGAWLLAVSFVKLTSLDAFGG